MSLKSIPPSAPNTLRGHGCLENDCPKAGHLASVSHLKPLRPGAVFPCGAEFSKKALHISMRRYSNRPDPADKTTAIQKRWLGRVSNDAEAARRRGRSELGRRYPGSLMVLEGLHVTPHVDYLETAPRQAELCVQGRSFYSGGTPTEKSRNSKGRIERGGHHECLLVRRRNATEWLLPAMSADCTPITLGRRQTGRRRSIVGVSFAPGKQGEPRWRATLVDAGDVKRLAAALAGAKGMPDSTDRMRLSGHPHRRASLRIIAG
ncbi:uncharacterized protein J3D65DRAFT_633596 [Phyllosticta citribraziliensis]|uniref:Uncharacterized protein n=1 Tax=Phyllosticta citribraziliensis TaxID=989973 RepID=A0ABR1LCA3_9PEZI